MNQTTDLGTTPVSAALDANTDTAANATANVDVPITDETNTAVAAAPETSADNAVDADSVATGEAGAKITLNELRQMLSKLRQRFPTLGEYRPLAIGSDKEIFAACPELSRKTLRRLIRFHTNSTPYLKNTLLSQNRFHLDGTPAQEITDKEREHSNQTLQERYDKLRSAQRQAPAAKANLNEPEKQADPDGKDNKVSKGRKANPRHKNNKADTVGADENNNANGNNGKPSAKTGASNAPANRAPRHEQGANKNNGKAPRREQRANPKAGNTSAATGSENPAVEQLSAAEKKARQEAEHLHKLQLLAEKFGRKH